MAAVYILFRQITASTQRNIALAQTGYDSFYIDGNRIFSSIHDLILLNNIASSAKSHQQWYV